MIKYEITENIDVIFLQNGKVNALDLELLTELESVLEKTVHSQNQATILTGAGSCFSAGVDLFRVVKDGPDYLADFLPVLSSCLERVFSYPKPIVAAINGHAIAGGCLLAWACDYTIMAADSGRIGVSELAVGVPFPAMPLEIVRSVVPAQYFREVVYGAATYAPETALAMGILDAVAPQEKLFEKALSVARQYAEILPTAFKLTKLGMRQPVLKLVENADHALAAQISEFWQSDEAKTAIGQYLKKTIGKKE